jgi:glycosyltransferase involved in cell wall biosynthesis
MPFIEPCDGDNAAVCEPSESMRPRQPIHIVMVSDFETKGGAAIAASRLAEAFCQAGHLVTRIVLRPDDRVHCWTTMAIKRSLYIRILRLFTLVTDVNLIDRACQRKLNHILGSLCPDVINVHNLHGASSYGWSPQLLRVCAAHAPVVWTLHDMSSFTGRCAYSYSCRAFLTGCDEACPTPDEYPARKPMNIAPAWKQRHNLFAELPGIVAVTPSRWLAREAQVGLWTCHRVEVIPNGLPLEKWYPLDRDMARSAVGIESPQPVIMLAAPSLSDPRKGGALFLEALRDVSYRPFTILTIGSGQLNIDLQGIHLHQLGYLEDERSAVLAYNAADILVHPAISDNLPNVVLEAIACGTPVVGLPAGGVPEMVRCHQTGWLADGLAAQALACALETAFGEISHGVNLRDSCRSVAEGQYSAILQAQRYLSLFYSLISG